MKSHLLFLTALGIVTLRVSAQSPSSAATNICIEVQMISMHVDKGLPLLPNLRDAGSIDGACSQIQKMIASGEATLNARPTVVTKSGQRAVTEDIQEVRYASQFGPRTPTAATSAGTPTSEPSPVVRGGAPIPTQFETRNIGSTLEVEPVLSPDGKIIDINLVPQRIRLLEFAVVASGRDANGHDWKIEQPRFYTAKTTTSLSVPTGQRVLLAEFRGPEGSDQIEFFILKAEVTAGAGTKAK